MHEPADQNIDDDMLRNSLRLEVHPSVVFKLGEDLITDDMQALIELVKNSYDADASRVKVAIDTQILMDAEGNPLSDEEASSICSSGNDEGYLCGSITISDDGFGMNMEAIKKGWLTISHSHKKEMKWKGETTQKDRTPLGDKGLGRLGAQRLGSIISLITKKRRDPDGSPEGEEIEESLKVVLNWDKFQDAENLSAVPIPVEKDAFEERKNPGTTLNILGLRNVNYWRQGETLELQKELASMISPYKSVSGFKVSLYIDGKRVNLHETTQAILSVCPAMYRFSFDGEDLVVCGAFRTTLLRPSQGYQDKADYENLIDVDGGYEFCEWLVNEKQKHAKSLGVEQGDDQFFIHSQYRIKLKEVEGAEFIGDELANPGPFHGEVSSVPLTRDETSIFDKASDYREFARALVGVKVYRDGFGVRVDEDWLGLGSKWTSGTSYYGLRPGNVTGYVNISAKNNSALEETTNREAFRDTSAYRNFSKLLDAWLDYTGRVQEYIRRSYLEYKKIKLESGAEVEKNSTPESVIRSANEHLHKIEKLAEDSRRTKEIVGDIRKAALALDNERKGAKKDLFSSGELDASVEKTVQKVESAAIEADILLEKLEGLFDEQERLKSSVRLLSHQIEISEAQINEAWESVALGLSAELLAHEVNHISSGLRGRSAQITKYMKGKEIKDQRMWSFVEHVRSSSSALTKQVSRLTPSLRYVRENKSDLSLLSFFEGLKKYHVNRWGEGSVDMKVTCMKDFSVRINEGKLTQIFDNLILNSEYWLFRSARSGGGKEPEIQIDIEAPYITFRDNGPGVDVSVEELIFDPFVTLKPSRQGRGLGLFVVRQLLDSEQSYISLTPSRNSLGRRYEFRVNLSGCMV